MGSLGGVLVAGKIRKIVFLILMLNILSFAVAIPALAARIAVPKNVRWEGTVACWDEVEDAYRYEVQLYKGSSKVDSVSSTTSTSLDMAGRMREKGKYTFRVRILDRVADDYGNYSAASGVYVQEKDETTKTRKKTDSLTPGKEAGERSPGPGVVGKNWKQDARGWWYDNADGSYLSNGWYQLNNKWYYFDASGYLQTGWLRIDGAQYYSYSDGSRVTGWAEIDGGYFYFNESGIYDPQFKE